MRNIVVFLAFLLCVQANIDEFDPYLDIPFKPIKSSADRIREHGYPAESHFVETKDGYVLNIFRIPHSPKLNNANQKRPAVLIQHGLLSCSDCYLLNGPDNALAYNYADAGFDVWLGNARGNLYSRNNTKISLYHPKFWEFSWHEIGTIDMPAMIDYILDLTGEEKLHYVGHSQGTTVFFVMTSSFPEYNDKIKTAHMLAPPIFMGNATDSTLVSLAPLFGKPGKGSRLMENQQFIPQNPFMQRLLDTACGDKPTFPDFCKTLFLLWAGPEQPNLNATLVPQIAETHPAGISTNQGIHYLQSHLTSMFRRYDWGVKKNYKLYGQETPPDYPLENITANLYLYYGLADESANAKDIQRLKDILPNIKYFHEVPNPTFGHIDFVFAMKVKEVINDQLIRFSLDYENGNDIYQDNKH